MKTRIENFIREISDFFFSSEEIGWFKNLKQ